MNIYPVSVVRARRNGRKTSLQNELGIPPNGQEFAPTRTKLEMQSFLAIAIDMGAD